MDVTGLKEWLRNIDPTYFDDESGEIFDDTKVILMNFQDCFKYQGFDPIITIKQLIAHRKKYSTQGDLSFKDGELEFQYTWNEPFQKDMNC